jgi:hypothetical protein
VATAAMRSMGGNLLSGVERHAATISR